MGEFFPLRVDDSGAFRGALLVCWAELCDRVCF